MSKNGLGGALIAASYEQQLDYLNRLVDKARAHGGVWPATRELYMLLSLAESVKTARDHNLNCPSPSLEKRLGQSGTRQLA